MKLEIDMPEHHYNNIIAFDSVSLGRVPYKGIIMYAINAIKRGKALEQEPFINKPCVSSGVCEHDKQKVLDKVYVEIEELQRDMLYASKVEFNDIYKILDKYRAESEDEKE